MLTFNRYRRVNAPLFMTAVLVAVVGCSDDSVSPTSSGTATSSSTAGSASAGTGGTTEGTGGAAQGVGGHGTTGVGGDGGSSQGGAGGSGATECVPADVLATIEKHLDDLTLSAQFMATHPGPTEAVGFLLAPGLPVPPAVSNVFAGPLIQVCSRPLMYDPYCDQGNCSRIECTGNGAGWIMHHSLDEPLPLVEGDWTFAEANVDTHWEDGATGITFDISVEATGPEQRNWALSGSGQMDTDLMQVEETFPSLFEAGATVVTINSTPELTTGSIVIDGVTVAATNADGHLEVTGDCPQ